MNRNYFLFIIFAALVCLFLIFFSLWKEIDSPLSKGPPIEPPIAPFQSYISGVGIVEASSENIYIGTPVNRIVDKVLVKVGEKVKKDQILFKLEDQDLTANLAAQEAAYHSSLAKLEKLKAFPRPEDLADATAALNSTKIEWELAKNQHEMVQGLSDPRAISQEEKNRRFSNYQQSEAKWQQAQANWEKVKAGTWKPDLKIAQLEVLEAKANLNRIKAEIQRTIIESPIDGTVLQVKIHEGEFPPADTLRTPMMILGNIDEIYLRVSINQLDIPTFRPEAKAVAYLQEDGHLEYPLEFVRVEPFLVNKQNLTNEITEKVDTKVLQIIYRIIKNDSNLFVGQQLDVFIETKRKL